jgi:hypothetical protein
MAAKFLGISFEPSRPIIPFSNRYRVRAGPCSPSSRPFSGDRTNELAQPETNTESWKKVWDQAAGSAYVVNTVITRYMSLQQIKDEIDKLNQVDKTEIFRWLDVQAHTANLLFGLGVYRLVANRRKVGQKCQVIS